MKLECNDKIGEKCYKYVQKCATKKCATKTDGCSNVLKSMSVTRLRF